MPLPKILAPLMPRNSMRLNNKNKNKNVKTFTLSPPGLPFSPPQVDSNHATNQNGDPIIEISTTNENTSSDSINTEGIVEDQHQQEEEATENNAVVLRETPTSFESCEQDIIIESAKNNDTQQVFAHHREVSPASAHSIRAPEIDFAPPAEFMDDETIPSAPFVDLTEPAMVPLPDSPPMTLPKDNDVNENGFTTPIQAVSTQITQQAALFQPKEPESQVEFIKPTPSDYVPKVSESSNTESEASGPNFAMETTFHKTDGVKSKWMKMLFTAKGLVCKPERIEKNQRIKSVFISKFENESTATTTTAAGQKKSIPGAIDTNFVSAYDKKAVVLEEPDAKTPIYRRCNTSSTSLFHMETEEPVAPYKSPLIGSDAYNIKLLCDQSFFGRW